MVDQNDSMSALSTLEATRPIDPSRPACRSRRPNSQDVYCAPRSAWKMVPGAGRRRQRAISRALTTISEVIRSLIGPANDAARERVDDRGAVDPPVLRPVLCDVAEPEPVGCVGPELSLDEILVRRRVGLPPAKFATVGDAGQAVEAHQAGDTLLPNVNAESEPQLGQHPRCAIGFPRVPVDCPDRRGERLVCDLPGRWRAGDPFVVSRVETFRNRQATATGTPSAASSWTNGNSILGARSPWRNRQRLA